MKTKHLSLAVFCFTLTLLLALLAGIVLADHYSHFA